MTTNEVERFTDEWLDAIYDDDDPLKLVNRNNKYSKKNFRRYIKLFETACVFYFIAKYMQIIVEEIIVGVEKSIILNESKFS